MRRILSLLLIVFSPTSYAANVGDMAIRLVEDMIIEAKTVAEASQIKNKHARYCHIVNEYLNIEKLSKKVIGSSWKSTAKPDQQLFIQAFQSEMASFFMGRFEEYLDQAEVTFPSSVIDRNGRFDVQVSISQGNFSYVSITFTVEFENDQLFVIDAKILGMSFQRLKRSEYKRYRRDIPTLTSKIAEKLEGQAFPLCQGS